jgi:hypothetical protein
VEEVMEDVVTVRDRVSVNSVTFSRAPEAPDGAFRNFNASVEAIDSSTQERSTVGRIGGWFGWAAWLPEVIENPHLDGSVAAMMAEAAVGIGETLSSSSNATIEAVIMVDHLEVDDAWRASGLGRRIAEQLIDLLLLTPETTLFLAHFRLDPACGQQSVPGVEPAGHRNRLLEVHPPTGFSRWGGGKVWWLDLGTESRVA